MGKQVIFYMHPDDLIAFQDFLISKQLVAFQAISTSLPIEQLSSIKQGMEMDASDDARLIAIFSKYECDAISLRYNTKSLYYVPKHLDTWRSPEVIGFAVAHGLTLEGE